MRPEVVAIYCPLWHNYDHASSWKGEGWCEWELLRTAKPRFPGHRQPIVPEWGYFDESDPAWAAREIDLAADHGVDVFLFDWYWYSGVTLMHEALERGFLQAPNRNRIKFTLMYTNADWADYFPAPFDQPWNSWLPCRETASDQRRIIEYCIDHYFHQPNYWRVDGKLFWSVFLPKRFIEHLGGVTETLKTWDWIDNRLAKAGLPPLHRNGMFAKLRPDAVQLAADAGFHSSTSYNVIDTGKSSPNLTQRYEDLITAHQTHFDAMSSYALPFAPVATMGWDVSPRCVDIPWPFPTAKATGKHEYPYIHVVEGNTPELFGEMCRVARRHLEKHPVTPNMVMVNAWNEWTEGCYLLPDTEHGLAYLKAMQKAFA